MVEYTSCMQEALGSVPRTAILRWLDIELGNLGSDFLFCPKPFCRVVSISFQTHGACAYKVRMFILYLITKVPFRSWILCWSVASEPILGFVLLLRPKGAAFFQGDNARLRHRTVQ